MTSFLIEFLDNQLYYCLPLLLSCLVYLNSLGGDFVHDDLSAIRFNDDVTAAHETPSHDVESRSSIWSNDFWGTALSDVKSHKSYRPLTTLTFRWNYLVGGLNSIGYHIVNVVLHGVVTIVYARLCRKCLKTTLRTGVFSACLFAIHSIHTEAVAGIVGRADVLATLLFLLSFLAYHRFTKTKETISRSCLYWATGVFLAWASQNAKEHGIASLPVALLFDISTSRAKLPVKRILGNGDTSVRDTKAIAFLRIVGTSIAVGLMAFWRISMVDGQLPTFSDQDNPLALCHHSMTRVLSLLHLPVINMGLLLSPINLSYDWQTGSVPAIVTLYDVRNVFSFLFYLSIAVVTLLGFYRNNKVVVWSVLVLVIPMIPCSNLFYVVGFVVAERLLYMPSLGFCLLVGYGMDKLLMFVNRDANGIIPAKCSRKRRRIGVTESSWRILATRLIYLCGAITSMSLLVKTLCRNTEWSSRDTLFTSGLRTMPHNAKIHYNYANLKRDLGDWEQAIFHYRQTIRLWPTYSSAHNNLGTLLLSLSSGPISEFERSRLVDEAEYHFRRAVAVHEEHVHARYNLAIISICYRNDLDRAVSLLLDCLALDPQHKSAKKLYSWLLSRQQSDEKSYSKRPRNNRTESKQQYTKNKMQSSITIGDLLVMLLN